jgi:hypothetical protein
MIRRITWLAAALLSASALESTANAQLIILGHDWIREREMYNERLATDWVKSYLGRKPTEKELATLMQRLRTGTSPLAVQGSVLSSDEYYKKNGSTTKSFINAVFVDVLGRKVTPQELLQLTAKVNGYGRARFVAEFLASVQGPILQPSGPPVIIIP